MFTLFITLEELFYQVPKMCLIFCALTQKLNKQNATDIQRKFTDNMMAEGYFE